MSRTADQIFADRDAQIDAARLNGSALTPGRRRQGSAARNRTQMSLNGHLGAPRPARRASPYAILNQRPEPKASLADQIKNQQGNPHAQAATLLHAQKNNKEEYKKFNRWDLVKFDGAADLKKIEGLNRLPLGLISAKGADFSGADLQNANMVGGNFDGAIFSGANLVYAKMGGASLNGAQALHASFNKTDLSGASLGNATFTSCTFNHTNMQNAEATGLNILGGSSLGLDMRGAKAPGMTITGRHNEISLPDNLLEANLGGLTAVNPKGLGGASGAKTQPKVVIEQGPVAALTANVARPSPKPWAGMIAAPGFV